MVNCSSGLKQMEDTALVDCFGGVHHFNIMAMSLRLVDVKPMMSTYMTSVQKVTPRVCPFSGAVLFVVPFKPQAKVPYKDTAITKGNSPIGQRGDFSTFQPTRWEI